MTTYNLKRGLFEPISAPHYETEETLLSTGINDTGYQYAHHTHEAMRSREDTYDRFFSHENVNMLLDSINSALNNLYKKAGRPILVTYDYIRPMMEKIMTYHYRPLVSMNEDLISNTISGIEDQIEQMRQFSTYGEANLYDGHLGIKSHQVTRVLPKARYYSFMNY